MKHAKSIYHSVYKNGNLFGVDKKIRGNPFKVKGKRPNSVALCGGAFGDEGKGRVTDDLTARFLHELKKVVLYKDNGGSNAGHTVEFGDTKLALHQLGSGVFSKDCALISGKGMVIHPVDFVEEINQVKQATGGKMPAKLMIDEMACLCLDTHRAFEYAIKFSAKGYGSSTGRGISQAYADILHRNPLRMRDLVRSNWQELFKKHYLFYRKMTKGLGLDLKNIEVSRLGKKSQKVGSVNKFLSNLETARKELKAFIVPCDQYLKKTWASEIPIIFEKAQALGLDKNWSVYPDCTASDCTFEGIRHSTEGVVDPHDIAVKTAVIKATYSSSVGCRVLPSQMETKLAGIIREDADEYGATTGRPRDIHYLDIPLISYLMRVGQVEYLVPTHLDIVYKDQPIKVCVGYKKNGKPVDYRPDQEYLMGVKPVFMELPSWDREALKNVKKPSDLPKEALQYLAFLSQALNVKILMATTGPRRNQTVRWY